MLKKENEQQQQQKNPVFQVNILISYWLLFTVYSSIIESVYSIQIAKHMHHFSSMLISYIRYF